MIGRLTGAVLAHKRLVVVAWLVLAVAGLATVGTTTNRLTESFALPGQPGYETNALIDRVYGTGGAQEASIATVTLPAGERTTSAADRSQVEAVFRAAASGPGHLRLLDAATSGQPRFSSSDGRTAYAAIFTPAVTSPTQPDLLPGIATRLRTAAPAGWQTGTTGIVQLTEGGSSGSGLLLEVLLGAGGALLVLAFVFASFLALLPLLMAAVAVPTTFLFVLGLTALFEVSFVVQFRIGLIGRGGAIDYSLLVVSRWREARAAGADNDAAVRQAMDTAGRSVVLSGTTVAVSLLALAVLPVPYLRSVGLAGFLIPLTSVAVAITLLPVLLATVGPRMDHPRIRRELSASRPWTAWAGFVVRHRVVAAVVGLAIVAVLIAPFFALRTGSPTSDSLAQNGAPRGTLDHLTAAGVPSGVITPVEVVTRPADADRTRRALESVPGVWLAAAPDDRAFRRGQTAIVDVLPAEESSTPAGRATVDRIETVAAADPAISGVGGTGVEDRDFGKAVYGRFFLVLAIIGIVTLLLLTRALRSIVLAAKAVLFNLASVGIAYGVMVFVWQQGHGSDLLFGIPATGSVTVWVPIAVFAYLFGLSMDYEVFILTRMREAYDETGSTTQAIVTAIGRTGRLVSSAALILFLAFVALASGPETNIKILATGLGAGILVDALIVRSILVPAFVSLFGTWNWYLPAWLARALRVKPAP